MTVANTARPVTSGILSFHIESTAEAVVIFNNLTTNPYKAAPFVKRQITTDCPSGVIRL